MSLVDDIKEILDETGTSRFWPVSQIYDAANASLIEIYGRTRHTKASAPFIVYEGSTHVAMPVDTIMIPQYITRGGKECPITDYEHLERYKEEWQGETADEPKVFVLWDWKHVRPWPTPDGDYEFVLWGVPWPVEISDSNQDITGNPILRRAVMYLAASKLCEATQPAFADAYRSESDRLEYEYKKQQRSEHTRKIRALRPGYGYAVTRTGDMRIIKRYGV